MVYFMVTREYLIDTFFYDPNTGIFTNKVRRSKRAKAGDVAGSLRPDGYWSICIKGKPMLAHRLAWLYVTGVLPDRQIDHINGNRSDNRFSNFRAAEHCENARNKRVSRNNTSGFKGVSYSERHKKWTARIMLNHKSFFLGLFDSPEDAHAAYVAAASRLHGEFASSGEILPS